MRLGGGHLFGGRGQLVSLIVQREAGDRHLVGIYNIHILQVHHIKNVDLPCCLVRGIHQVRAFQ